MVRIEGKLNVCISIKLGANVNSGENLSPIQPIIGSNFITLI